VEASNSVEGVTKTKEERLTYEDSPNLSPQDVSRRDWRAKKGETRQLK